MPFKLTPPTAELAVVAVRKRLWLRLKAADRAAGSPDEALVNYSVGS
jgi:hypothetical protein